MWDAVADSRYLSLEGLTYAIQQATSLQATPSLDTPVYTVLRKTKEYEVSACCSLCVLSSGVGCLGC